MMWICASLLILNFLGGSFAERDCSDRETDECPTLDNIPRASSIETPEQLLKVCRMVETSGSCYADAMERCDENHELMTSIRHIVSYLKTTCQEDNPIFQTIYSNLKCLSKVVEGQGSCLRSLSNMTREILSEHIDPYFEEGREDSLDCLFDVTEMACPIITFGYHCGTEVREAFEDLFENTLGMVSSCTAEQLEEMEPLFELFEALLVEDLKALKEKDNE